MGGKQRTHMHPFLDPKLAVESIGEVPRVPRAHLEVEFAQTIVRFSPPLYGAVVGTPSTRPHLALGKRRLTQKRQFNKDIDPAREPRDRENLRRVS